MQKLLKAFWRKSGSRSEALAASELKIHPIEQSRFWLTLEIRLFIVMALALVFYFIACNSGSGWLYLLSSALIVVVITGCAGPVLFVNSLTVEQKAPSRCVAGQSATVAVKLSSRLPAGLPLFWLRLTYQV